MFELPEYVNLSRQIKETLKGKKVENGALGNSPHKFVWYNKSHEEFAEAMKGKVFGDAYSRGRWLFINVDPGYVLVFGECGGKILYHEKTDSVPKKYHLLIKFADKTAFSAMTQMWGAMELYKKGEELNRKYIKDMRTTPIDAGFTFDYFSGLIDECLETDVKSVKGVLTQNQIIPGLGNAIAQDIMFNANLNPKRPLKELTEPQRKKLYEAIAETTQAVLAKNGRNDEYDLFGRKGGYERIMDKDTEGKPCPKCNTPIQKVQYLGGACYYCPKCQK